MNHMHDQQHPVTAETQESARLEWNLTSAETAYSVIATYTEHVQISGLVIAALAHAVGEEQLKSLVQSEPWQLYMASKRQLEEARQKIASLTALIDHTREQQASGE